MRKIELELVRDTLELRLKKELNDVKYAIDKYDDDLCSFIISDIKSTKIVDKKEFLDWSNYEVGSSSYSNDGRFYIKIVRNVNKYKDFYEKYMSKFNDVINGYNNKRIKQDGRIKQYLLDITIDKSKLTDDLISFKGIFDDYVEGINKIIEEYKEEIKRIVD